jgi:hypothetical protein
MDSSFGADNLRNRLARFLLFKHLSGSVCGPNQKEEVTPMRYAIAWLLGVPASIIVIWFVVGHLL